MSISLGEVDLSGLTTTKGIRSVSAAGSRIQLDKSFVKDSTISPTQITSDQNNYSPTGLSTANIIYLDADSSFRSIGGLAAQQTGFEIDLTNGSSNTILLADEATNLAASSTAANRFALGGADVPIFPKSTITLTYNGTLSRWVLKSPAKFLVPPSRFGNYFTNEMLHSSDNLWIYTALSGGTAATVGAVAGHPGIVKLTAGTSATGSGGIRYQQNDCLILGNSWYYRWDAIIDILTLSDGTNTYTMRSGFLDSVTTEPTDGVYFRYTHSVNSGKWVLVARQNGTETTTNATNTAVAAATWYHLTVVVNPAGNNADYFQNGVYLGSVTSNIPTGSTRLCGYGSTLLKSAGTTDIDLMQIDSQSVLSYANTAR